MTNAPEARRDETIEAILEIGGVVLSEAVPMATQEDPHVIVAYRINAGAPDLSVRSSLRELKNYTQVSFENLVDWVPPFIDPILEE